MARGTLVNAGFLGLVNGLAFVRGVFVAAVLSTQQYGVWGIVSGAFALLMALRQNGVRDRYVQQDEPDQERAFHVALTLELALSGALMVLALLVFPTVAFVYGHTSLVWPGLALSLVLPCVALQAPLGVFYRRMDFRRQRSLQAIDPIVAFVVTVGLVATGAGYWGMIAGTVAGALAGALAAVKASPYSLRLCWDRESLGRYIRFTWPMLLAAVVAVALSQGLLLSGEASLGLAGAGFVTLSLTIATYANRVDQIVASTLYPALCAVRDRADLLLESFVKSNRASALWGVPLGLGLAVFAPAAVDHVLGPEWDRGIPLLEATGVAVAVHRLGYNWDTYFRAVGHTSVVATNSVIVLGVFAVTGLPLAIFGGMSGLAAAVLVLEVISIVARAVHLRRLFSLRALILPGLQAITPGVLAAGAVLALRSGGAGLGLGPELGLFAVVTLVISAWLERDLLQEAIAYVRRPAVGVTPA